MARRSSSIPRSRSAIPAWRWDSRACSPSARESSACCCAAAASPKSRSTRTPLPRNPMRRATLHPPRTGRTCAETRLPSPDSISVQRAAGAVLRALKRHGAPANRLTRAARAEPLRPSLAIEALLAAMRAQFGLPEPAADELLRPALADWRDAVGCTDPLLVPADAVGPTGEKHLLPIPMPSWCAPLVDAGVVHLDGPAAVDGPRIVQAAWLAVVRESELTAVECFPLVFAGRYGSGAASLRIHLALSPPFLSPGWRGSVCLRAGAQRLDGSRTPVRLWLGAAASPGSTPNGVTGEGAVTWAMPRLGSSVVADWPADWQRWAVLRVREGREPNASGL